ncbi:MAG: VanZ family protein [Robiginitomaculum sp.]|nr:VanZ family protein [Robiginitomaculum sp.]
MTVKKFSLLVILAKPAFLLALITVTFLSLWPGSASPPTFLWSDKLNHAIAYFFLTIGLIVGWKFTLKNRLIAIVCLLAWGAVLEIIQGLPLVGRTASGMDLVANAAGILLAMLVGWLFSLWYRHKD